MFGVDLNVLLPLIRNILVAENRFDRTGWLTGSAINTFVRMDIEHFGGLKFRLILARVDAIHRADVNTGRILRADAGFANYVNSHYAFLLQYSYEISGE